MSETYIEHSAEQRLDAALVQLIRDEQPLLISGMPLRVFHPTDAQQDTFFAACEDLDEEIILPPFRVFMQRILSRNHSYLDDRYTHDTEEGYPALQGFLIDHREVVLGIREALTFTAKPVELDQGNS